MDHLDVWHFDPKSGVYQRSTPSPFYFGLFPWIWRRLTGWRDEYGRKAHFIGFR